MSTTNLKHLQEDLDILKQDISVIKHILSEEGELTKNAVRRLHRARNTSDSKFVKF